VAVTLPNLTIWGGGTVEFSRVTEARAEAEALLGGGGGEKRVAEYREDCL
jgi:hypothetical protein